MYAYILQSIVHSLRSGGPEELKLERFMEAVSASEGQLSYHSFRGTRKRSVSDAEQLFGLRVVGEKIEAKHARVVRNWRRACDERGLTVSHRIQYHNNFLSYILEEMIPWYDVPGMRNSSLLEVNQ